MNKRQVIILWAIALGLGITVTAVKISQNKSIQSATKREHGQTLFEKFPAEQITSVMIQGATGEVDLVKKDGKWLVANRDAYPAKQAAINDFLRTLAELKVTRGTQADPSFAPRFGMDETATQAEERGITATFKDESGKEVAKISLGKNIQSESAPSQLGMGGNSVGRYIRNYADDSGFYAVSEMFPSMSEVAKNWLSDEFITVDKIKSIRVTLPGKTDLAWQLVRETEEAEFKLEGAKEAEVLDTTVTHPLKSLFSYARFEDVVPAAKVAERMDETQKRIVTIETVEGFVYQFEISPTKPVHTPPQTIASPDTPPPAPTDNFLMTVSVTAELPQERKKEDGEKPEDAAKKDTAFAEHLKELKAKLTKEKSFSGVTFEVSKNTIESLLKDRAGLITRAKPSNGQGANVQKLPGGMIARPSASPVEAVTPPITVPGEIDETELDNAEEGAPDEGPSTQPTPAKGE